jgi:hypothetical protein
MDASTRTYREGYLVEAGKVRSPIGRRERWQPHALPEACNRRRHAHPLELIHSQVGEEVDCRGWGGEREAR